MKKQICCSFTDFWADFDYKIHLRFLLLEYDLVIDDKNPDYLFYSCFGMRHLNYENCIKIFWSGENLIPDLNMCDYAISLSNIQCDDRTIRNCWVGRYPLQGLFEGSLEEEILLQRKFCNFVYGNNSCADPYRLEFYKKLSEYKKIDSAGSLMNNMNGFKVPECESKNTFISKYKFTIAIENSSISGYSTEKIYEPFLAHSLPIYWGCPNISSYYNTNSFVNLMDFSSIKEAVEEVIRLDNDDTAYLEKITTPFWPSGNSFEGFYEIELERMLSFFRNIFEQPLEKARRRTEYGNVQGYYSQMKRAFLPPEQQLKDKYIRSLKGIVKKVIRK